jgi:hypothetical protein
MPATPTSMEFAPEKMNDRQLLFLALEQQHKLTPEEKEAVRKELRSRIENGRHVFLR